MKKMKRACSVDESHSKILFFKCSKMDHGHLNGYDCVQLESGLHYAEFERSSKITWQLRNTKIKLFCLFVC